MIENTPTSVLLVRDWTIFFEIVCMAAGNSCKHKSGFFFELHKHTRVVWSLCQHELKYLDARVYGTDEEDIGHDKEDRHVDSQHYWGAEEQKPETHL